MEYDLMILLGGKSSRFQGDINKVYCLINNKPLFLNSLDIFLKFKEIKKIILVYNSKDELILKEILHKYGYNRLDIECIMGGEDRYNSVYNGLLHCNYDNVIVHDGARPNIDEDTVKKALRENEKFECVSVAVKMSDTVKEVTKNSFKTICRDNLYIMQTPQITRTKLLFDCLKNVKKEDGITDDLMAIEKYSNVLPHLVMGNKNNFKITTNEDYILMKNLMEGSNV